MAQEKIKIGEIGVDSGQLMICDPCFIDSEWIKQDVNFSKESSQKETGEFSYDGSCKGIMNKQYSQMNFKKGQSGAGVSFSSGFGDGRYEVIATFKDYGKSGKRIKKVEIILIEE